MLAETQPMSSESSSHDISHSDQSQTPTPIQFSNKHANTKYHFRHPLSLLTPAAVSSTIPRDPPNNDGCHLKTPTL